MPNYFYTAKSKKGGVLSGKLEAKNEMELAKILRLKGYFLISASLKNKRFELKNVSFSFGVPLVEKLMFARNLGVMISAGIDLPKALKILSLQTKNSKLKKVLISIRENILKGKNFSESLTKYPNIFSEFFCSMVKTGEETGNLENVLKNLTLQMEKDYHLRAKIKGAMIYPAVIMLTMSGIGILMLTMVIPKLAATFEELNLELPATTQAIIFIGYFLKEKWYLFILFTIVFLYLFLTFARTKKGKRIIDSLILKLPIISPIVKKTNAAYVTRTLSSLMASGVPIVKSLRITSKVLENSLFRESLSNAANKVKKGEKLSDALEPYQNLYPISVIQMIKVGEETGETSNILEKLADFFEEEVSNATENMTDVIEPILIVVIGIVVGFFAVSMIQPMYSMLGGV
ncbi:MAG TPA: type II secretion system F family protein [bacterium]|nr:type II secretion system F family protein [bacterium]